MEKQKSANNPSFHSQIFANQKGKHNGHQHDLQMGQKISNDFEAYKNFFDSSPFQKSQETIAPFLQKLSQNKIQYHKSNFISQLSIFSLYETQATRILTFLVGLSYFTFEITAINLAEESIFQALLPKSAHGGTANIFRVQTNSKTFVVKSIRTKHTKYSKSKNSDSLQITKTLRQAIKQYCLTKLFSIFEVGPKVESQFGFDFLIWKNCVEFCLEQCQTYKQLKIQNLKYPLMILHGFKIIHGDIKSTNIMWSNQYKRIVLIDFGFSQTLPEKPGEMTLTCYFGTLSFSSPEMKKLFTDKSCGYVDLYFNDVFCSIESIRNQNFQPFLQSFNIDGNKKLLISNYTSNLHLSYLIYKRDIEKVSFLLKKNPKFQVSSATLSIFQELPSEPVLYKIFCLLQNYHTIAREEKDTLKQYHCRYQKFSYTIQLVEQRKRIQNILLQERPKSFVMYAIFLAYGQDTTLRAKFRKKELFALLMSQNQVSKEYCYLLMQYVNNLYTTKKEIVDIFSHTLSMFPQNQKRQLELKRFELYDLARQTITLIYKKLSINMLEANYEYECARKAQAKMQLPKQLEIWREKLKKNLNLFNFLEFQQNEQIYQPDFRNFYPFEKCKGMCLFMDFYEGSSFLNLDMQTYLTMQQKKSEICVNHCLDSRILTYFLFANQIEEEMFRPTSIGVLQQKIERLEQYFKYFISEQSLSSLLDFIATRLKKFTFYEITQYKEYASYFISRTIAIADRQIKKFQENFQVGFWLCSSIYNFIFSVARYQSTLVNILTSIEILKESKYPNWDMKEESFEHMLIFFHRKVRLQIFFSFFQKYKILKELYQVQKTKLSLMNSHSKISVHFQIFYALANQTLNEDLCEDRIERISNVLSNMTLIQKEKYIEQKFLDIMISVTTFYITRGSFQKFFAFLTKNFQIYHIHLQNNIQKHFVFYFTLTKITKIQFQKVSPLELARMYIRQYEKRKSTNFWFGGLVTIFEMILLYFYNKTKDQLFQASEILTKVVRILLKIVMDSPSLIKRFFNQKIYSILLSFNTKEVLPITNSKKIRNLERMQLRTYQYPIKKFNGRDFLRKKGLKGSENQFHKKIIVKLGEWNDNKKMIPHIKLLRLPSHFSILFIEILSQNNFC